MNLYRLSLISIVACVVGLALLLALTVRSADQMNDKQAAVADLLELDERIDALSSASDSLLVQGADQGLWQAYLAEAHDLRRELEDLGEAHPDAHKAAHRIEVMVEAVETALDGFAAETGAPVQGIVPLEVPIRSRIIMQQVANQGIALDTALDDALDERQQAIAREARWIGAALAGSALLFGALCVVAFGLIHRRMALPARTLVRTLERIRGGDADARSTVSGNDELSRLASTLNKLLDEGQAAEREVAHRQRLLEDALAELTETRDQLLRAQQIGNMGSWEVRYENGERLEWSDQALKIFGVERGDFDGSVEEFFKLVHPDDRGWLRKRRRDWLDSGGEFDAEYRIMRPDRELRWVLARAQSIIGSDGEIVRSNGVLQDITDRKRQEAEIRQFKDLVEGSDDMCCIIDENYRYVWANRAYRDRHDMSRDDLKGQSVREVIGEKRFSTVVEPRLKACMAGDVQRFESERSYPGMGPRQLLVRNYPLIVPHGAGRRIGVVITDVSDIRAARAELAAQAHLLDIAGRAADFGGWSIDLKKELVKWSDVTAEIHGMPHGHMPTVEEGIEFFAPEDRERIRSRFTACAEEGTPYDEELQIIDANGQRRWVRAVGEPVRNDAGSIVKVQGAIQDITERKTLELERQGLADRLATMMESITDAFLAFDENWRYVYANAEAERLLGKSAGDLLGTNLWSQLPDVVGTETEAALRQARNEGRASTAEEYFEPFGGWFEVRVYPWEGGVAVFVRDVTAYHEMVAQFRAQHEILQRSRDRLDALLETQQALINSLPANIALLDNKANIVDVNRQWREFGEQNDSPDPTFGVGMNYLAVCDSANTARGEEATSVADGLRAVLAGQDDSFQFEYPCHSPDGKRWFRVMFNRLSADQSVPGGAVAMHVDVTARKLAEHQLEKLAYHDPLTDLLSRNGFTRELRAWLEGDWPEDGLVVMLDVVNQRDVNDSHGYEAGDQVLARLGERLQAHVGERGLVGRGGGDEFVLFLAQGAGDELEETLRNLDRRVEEPLDLGGLSLEIQVWIGFTELGEHRRDAEDLLREAELALFENRSDRGARMDWMGYSPALDERTRQRIELTKDLRQALEADEFELHFQPKVDLIDGSMISAEALLRWQHPERGLQSPGLFIPIAERSQLIGPIGDWVLRDACRQLKDWREAGLDIVRVSINVSLMQLALGGFPAKVRKALTDFDIPPSALALEITESVFERQSETLLAQIRELNDIGVRLSLDDFGTGYSSLLYLQQYPFDEIKIDRAFVSRLLDDDYSRNIVRTVMEVARALNADAVAEGIESREIADALLEIGCSIGQGYYYSMPLEAEDFRWLLGTHSALPLSSSANGT